MPSIVVPTKKPALHVKKRRLMMLSKHLLTPQVSEHWDYSHTLAGCTGPKANLEACGTTACAFGHATSIPALRRLGFGFWARDMGSLNDVLPTILGCSNPNEDLVFGLNTEDWDYLFQPCDDDEHLPYDATPADVSERIVDYVENLTSYDRDGDW